MLFSVHYNCNAQQHIYKLNKLTYTVIYIANLTGIVGYFHYSVLRFVLEIIAQVTAASMIVIVLANGQAFTIP